MSGSISLTTQPGLGWAPVAETGFSHILTVYKLVGHFFGLSYRKTWGSNQVKISFFRISNISAPCPHAQFRGSTVFKKLWTFFGPWDWDRSQSPPCLISRAKQIHSSTASERTTRQGWGKPYNSVIFLYKPWRPKDFFQFEIIINVLVSSFCFIWIPMVRVYDHYKYLLSQLTLDVRMIISYIHPCNAEIFLY